MYLKMASNIAGCYQNGKKITSAYVGDKEIMAATPISFAEHYAWDDIGVNAPEIDTYRANNMYAMFAYCYDLQNMEAVSNYRTNFVKDISSMFTECQNITSLNLSKWHTNNITDATSLFDGCYNLTNYATKQYVDEQIAAAGSSEGKLDALGSITGIWGGSQAEYDALTTKDSKVLYFIQE